MVDFISKVTLPNNNGYPIRASAIPYGEVDSTSTSTAFTATVPGLYELKDGVCVYLRNNVVTSAANFTIDINNLGAKPVYSNLANATRQTTLFNANYTILFIYNENRVEDGCWDLYRGYDSNTNTIGYQLRTNSTIRTAADKGYRYRLWFQTLDGKWAPANLSTSTNDTASRTPNSRVIDPFGQIIYYSTNGTTNANANLLAITCWTQYILSLGYSFNTTGKTLTLTHPAPVYLKCTPQTTGGVVMNGYVQALPSSADGKVYIYLGMAYSATSIELVPYHPVYYHDGNGIKPWNGYNITDLLPSPLSSYHTTKNFSTSSGISTVNVAHNLNTKHIIVSVQVLDNETSNTFTASQSAFIPIIEEQASEPDAPGVNTPLFYGVKVVDNNNIQLKFCTDTWCPDSGTLYISVISAIAYSSASDESLLRIS